MTQVLEQKSDGRFFSKELNIMFTLEQEPPIIRTLQKSRITRECIPTLFVKSQHNTYLVPDVSDIAEHSPYKVRKYFKMSLSSNPYVRLKECSDEELLLLLATPQFYTIKSPMYIEIPKVYRTPLPQGTNLALSLVGRTLQGYESITIIYEDLYQLPKSVILNTAGDFPVYSNILVKWEGEVEDASIR